MMQTYLALIGFKFEIDWTEEVLASVIHPS
jgi:hypothetical protein